jgi:uncharacterized protein (TIGR03437 family)
MRRLGLFFLLAAPVHAQFFDFAVTDDGQLYFSSTLMTGATKDIATKVYRWSDRGPELFATGGGGDDIFGVTASAPLVSGDGAITGWAKTQPCRSPSCPLAGGPRTLYELEGVGFTNLPYNYLQISRNGRYLLGMTADFRLRLIELPSQRSTELAAYFGWAGPQTIADTGAALIRDPNSSILLYRPLDGDARVIPGTEGVTNAALSRAGDRIAFERKRGGAFELLMTDPAGTTQQALASAAAALPYGYQPRFANDGTLLYIDADQQPRIVAPGGEAKPLARVETGVQRAIPSGDGSVVWLESNVGQLLRVRVADGSIEEVVPTTPYVASGGTGAYSGSVIHFGGTGLSKTTRFRLGDVALPLSALEKDGAAVQIPWDYSSTQYQEVVTVQGDRSPFYQQTTYFPLTLPRITFEREFYSRSLNAAHQDWRGVIGHPDPAAPGETIHVFAANLGPVDQPVATGQPSPDPPARVTTPFACYLSEVEEQSAVRPRGLVVPFAGLSPGLIGIYHIDVTIPADWTAHDATLECRMDIGGPLYAGDSARIVVGSR